MVGSDQATEAGSPLSSAQAGTRPSPSLAADSGRASRPDFAPHPEDSRLALEASRRSIAELERRLGHETRLRQELERDNQVLRASKAELETLAACDPLTGLFNRRSFQEEVKRLSGTLGTGRFLAVAVIDLDRFKLVNDTFGHEEGDELLIAVADRISALDDDDVACRLGGDEFAVARIVPDLEAARELGGELAEELDQTIRLQRHRVALKASVGVAFGSEFTAEPSSLLRDADTAMYQAKRSPGTGHLLFDGRFGEEVTRRYAIERGLASLIGKGDLRLVFQPIISSDDGRAVGVEALSRWTTPDLGPVSPLEFFEVAESIGMGIELGNHALDLACQALAEWRASDQRLRSLYVSVNVTHEQLVSRNFVEVVAASLDRHGLPANHLVLEITESGLLEDFQRALASMDVLRRLGVRIAIDDFGTGYSALSYLARLPVDFLKIDQSFVTELGSTSDTKSTRLTEAIIDLARRFELTPIAEGVEAEVHDEAIRSLGCDLLQGHLFSRPRPADDPDLLDVLVGKDRRAPAPAPDQLPDVQHLASLAIRSLGNPEPDRENS